MSEGSQASFVVEVSFLMTFDFFYDILKNCGRKCTVDL